MNRAIITFILLVGALQPGWSQRESPYSLHFSVLHESYSLPTSGVGGIKPPLHPGIRAGTEFYYRGGGRSGFFQQVSLTYYFHRRFHHCFSLTTQVGYRYLHAGGFFADASLGTGYGFLLLDQGVYKPIGRGDFVTVKGAGLHRLLSSLALSAGHKVSISGRDLYPFVKYELMGESPFNRDTPLIPHVLLQSGVIMPVTQTPQP